MAQINSSAAQDLQTAVSGTGADQAIVAGSTDSDAITAISTMAVKSVGSAMSESLADSAFSTVGASAGSPASPSNGSTALEADGDQGSGFKASESSSTSSLLVAGDTSPSSQSAIAQTSSGGTAPSSGASAGHSAAAGPTPASTTLAAAPVDTVASTQTGTLGARGPPTPYGPVLILASTGGSISAGNATLTFAPGSLPHDAYVSVTVWTAPADGLVAESAAENDTAVDTDTGEVIEQFASAPQLTIKVGNAGGQAPQIHSLPVSGDPVVIPTTPDSTTGAPSAGLPHFSAYLAAPTAASTAATARATRPSTAATGLTKRPR